MSTKEKKKSQPRPEQSNREETLAHLCAVARHAKTLARALRDAGMVQGEWKPPRSPAANNWIISLHLLECTFNPTARPLEQSPPDWPLDLAQAGANTISGFPLDITQARDAVHAAFYAIAERLIVMERQGHPLPDGTVPRKIVSRTVVEPLPRALWKSLQRSANRLGKLMTVYQDALLDSDSEPAEDNQIQQILNPPYTAKEAAERLIELMRQGRKWSSYDKMTDQLGCTRGIVVNAVAKTPELKAWARPARDPKAQSLTPHSKRGDGWVDIVTDNKESDALGPVDEARINEYLQRHDLTQKDRAFFNSLPNAQRQLEYLNEIEQALEDLDSRNGGLNQRLLGRKV